MPGIVVCTKVMLFGKFWLKQAQISEPHLRESVKKSKINCINGKKGVTSRTEYTGAIWI